MDERRRVRLRASAGAYALATGLLLAGCGSGGAGPASDRQSPAASGTEVVREALASVGEASSASFTMALDGTLDDIAALDPSNPMSDSDRATLAKVLTGDVVWTVTAKDGETLADSATSGEGLGEAGLADPGALKAALSDAAAFSLAVRLDGSTLGEVRFVAAALYGRVDAPAVATLAGQDLAPLRAQAAQLPDSLAPLRAALDGAWVGVDLAKAVDAADSLGLLKQLASAPGPTPDPTAAQGLVQSLTDALAEDMTVTELGVGSRGQEYRVAVPGRRVLARLADDLRRLSPATGDLGDKLGQVPDRTFAVDVSVKDGALTGVHLGLGQFAADPSASDAAVDVAVDLGADPVAAPDGARMVDVAQALLGLGALTGRTS